MRGDEEEGVYFASGPPYTLQDWDVFLQDLSAMSETGCSTKREVVAQSPGAQAVELLRHWSHTLRRIVRDVA